MKSRAFNKRLCLKKKTVANLNLMEMKHVNAGGDAPLPWPDPDETLYSCTPGCTDTCCTQTTSNYPGAACC